MPRATKIEPKGSRSEAKNFPRQFLRNNVDKGAKNVCSVLILLDDRLGLKSFEKSIENSSRDRSPKKLKYMPKNFQHGAEIDAETDHKSLPKLVTDKNHEKKCFSE